MTHALPDQFFRSPVRRGPITEVVACAADTCGVRAHRAVSDRPTSTHPRAVLIASAAVSALIVDDVADVGVVVPGGAAACPSGAAGQWVDRVAAVRRVLRCGADHGVGGPGRCRVREGAALRRCALIGSDVAVHVGEVEGHRGPGAEHPGRHHGPPVVDPRPFPAGGFPSADRHRPVQRAARGALERCHRGRPRDTRARLRRRWLRVAVATPRPGPRRDSSGEGRWLGAQHALHAACGAEPGIERVPRRRPGALPDGHHGRRVLDRRRRDLAALRRSTPRRRVGGHLLHPQPRA